LNIYTLKVFVPLKLHSRYYWDADLVQIAGMPPLESELHFLLHSGFRNWVLLFFLIVSTEPATVVSQIFL